MMRACTLALVLTALLAPSFSEAADSARCQELGANCICNTTMDTTSISSNGADTQHFTLNDGVTKTCGGFDGVAPPYSIASGSGQVFNGVTSGEDISALPAARTVTAVLRSNTLSGAFLGHNADGSVPTARRSVRFYKYYSTAYNAQSTSDSSCNANKIAQFGQEFVQGPLFTTEGGTWTLYDISTTLGWNQSVDCCNGPGPGNAQNGPALSGLLGKWWRYEIITHNAATTGTGTSWQMYIKNVTDNAAELLVLDTSQTLDAQGWTSSFATGLHPTGTLDTMLINFFRSTNGATPCAGFASYSHYVYAAWDTDSNQRIGAATEIEGSGAQTYSNRFSGGFIMQGVARIQ